MNISPGQERPAEEPPSRRGRKPNPIDPSTKEMHRAWLRLLRSRGASSGLTLDDLGRRTGYSKGRISELLNGTGRYLLVADFVRSLRHHLGPGDEQTRRSQASWAGTTVPGGSR